MNPFTLLTAGVVQSLELRRALRQWALNVVLFECASGVVWRRVCDEAARQVLMDELAARPTPYALDAEEFGQALAYSLAMRMHKGRIR